MSVVAAANKRMVYCGGLAEDVDDKILRSAFLTFGDIIDISMPLDYITQKHKGFAFIEFESADDASAAIDNMNDSEIFGTYLCFGNQPNSDLCFVYRQNDSRQPGQAGQAT